MVAFFQHLASLIPSSDMAIVGVIGGIVEFVLRLVPSAKPLGLAHTVSDALKVLSDLFAKFSAFLDKILPQNVVPAPAPAAVVAPVAAPKV